MFSFLTGTAEATDIPSNFRTSPTPAKEAHDDDNVETKGDTSVAPAAVFMDYDKVVKVASDTNETMSTEGDQTAANVALNGKDHVPGNVHGADNEPMDMLDRVEEDIPRSALDMTEALDKSITHVPESPQPFVDLPSSPAHSDTDVSSVREPEIPRSPSPVFEIATSSSTPLPAQTNYPSKTFKPTAKMLAEYAPLHGHPFEPPTLIIDYIKSPVIDRRKRAHVNLLDGPYDEYMDEYYSRPMTRLESLGISGRLPKKAKTDIFEPSQGTVIAITDRRPDKDGRFLYTLRWENGQITEAAPEQLPKWLHLVEAFEHDRLQQLMESEYHHAARHVKESLEDYDELRQFANVTVDYAPPPTLDSEAETEMQANNVLTRSATTSNAASPQIESDDMMPTDTVVEEETTTVTAIHTEPVTVSVLGPPRARVMLPATSSLDSMPKPKPVPVPLTPNKSNLAVLLSQLDDDDEEDEEFAPGASDGDSMNDDSGDDAQSRDE
ncbi:hypothetical protein BZG36_03587 [Bifiguratus adelaidae]|uniref:Chromo domain-containing protein n=1 Tax=Bifiguratus adelaidae TaxID=1938954 RepID=A0A261XYH4_9FUNG|nr:hypothetical protein BZG36_03587 [Bifiguratus adelaidae]